MAAGNNNLEAVQEALRPVHAKIVGADEHKAHAERLIHTVKEITGCDFQNIPYMRCPKLTVV